MAETAAERTVGDAVVALLKANGVDTVFGIASVHMLDIYDALLRDGAIRLIIPRHEQAAVNMADGYARASGRIGVALTSTGPGAANSMGAMLEAYSARSPVLQLTSQVSSAVLGSGKGPLHEADSQERMFESVADYVQLCEAAGQTADALQGAFNHLREPGAGPAVVSIPVDLQSGRLESVEPSIPQSDGAVVPAPDSDYDRAAQILSAASHPVLLLGGGAVPAACRESVRSQLISLAESLAAPVLLTAEARGVFPEDHPLSLGSIMQEEAVDVVLAEADAMLAIGTRFRGMATRDWTAPVPDQLIQVDVNAEIIGRNYPVALGIVDDAANAIGELRGRLGGRASVPEDVVAWVAEVRAKVRETAAAMNPHLLGLADIVREVWPSGGILVADSTMIAYFAFNRVTPFSEPRSYLFPTSYAIGPSLPIAVGAALGAPERRVLQVAGDGGFMLNLAELATLVQSGAPVTSVILNDLGYGVLRMLQTMRFEGRLVGVDLHTPEFVALAESFGLKAARVDSYDGFREALTAARDGAAPRLIEVDLPALTG